MAPQTELPRGVTQCMSLRSRIILMLAGLALLYHAAFNIERAVRSPSLSDKLLDWLARSPRWSANMRVWYDLMFFHPLLLAGLAFLAILCAGWCDRVGRRAGLLLWWASCVVWALFLFALVCFEVGGRGDVAIAFLTILGTAALGGLASLIFHYRPLARNTLSCVVCGYDLRGSISGRCPECDSEFGRHSPDPSDGREPQ